VILEIEYGIEIALEMLWKFSLIPWEGAHETLYRTLARSFAGNGCTCGLRRIDRVL
jgi:hypothetical protein